MVAGKRPELTPRNVAAGAAGVPAAPASMMLWVRLVADRMLADAMPAVKPEVAVPWVYSEPRRSWPQTLLARPTQLSELPEHTVMLVVACGVAAGLMKLYWASRQGRIWYWPVKRSPPPRSSVTVKLIFETSS